MAGSALSTSPRRRRLDRLLKQLPWQRCLRSRSHSISPNFVQFSHFGSSLQREESEPGDSLRLYQSHGNAPHPTLTEGWTGRPALPYPTWLRRRWKGFPGQMGPWGQTVRPPVQPPPCAVALQVPSRQIFSCFRRPVDFDAPQLPAGSVLPTVPEASCSPGVLSDLRVLPGGGTGPAGVIGMRHEVPNHCIMMQG